MTTADNNNGQGQGQTELERIEEGHGEGYNEYNNNNSNNKDDDYYEDEEDENNATSSRNNNNANSIPLSTPITTTTTTKRSMFSNYIKRLSPKNARNHTHLASVAAVAASPDKYKVHDHDSNNKKSYDEKSDDEDEDSYNNATNNNNNNKDVEKVLYTKKSSIEVNHNANRTRVEVEQDSDYDTSIGDVKQQQSQAQQQRAVTPSFAASATKRKHSKPSVEYNSTSNVPNNNNNNNNNNQSNNNNEMHELSDDTNSYAEYKNLPHMSTKMRKHLEYEIAMEQDPNQLRIHPHAQLTTSDEEEEDDDGSDYVIEHPLTELVRQKSFGGSPTSTIRSPGSATGQKPPPPTTPTLINSVPRQISARIIQKSPSVLTTPVKSPLTPLQQPPPPKTPPPTMMSAEKKSGLYVSPPSAATTANTFSNLPGNNTFLYSSPPTSASKDTFNNQRKLITPSSLPPILTPLTGQIIKPKKEKSYKTNDDYFSDEEYDEDGNKRDIVVKPKSSNLVNKDHEQEHYQDEYDQLHAQSQAQDNSLLKKNNTSTSFIETLSVAEFKTMWKKLDIANSLQRKVEKAPTLTQLTEHFKRQNFHVVYATVNPKAKSTEIEIALCNIRIDESDIWFMCKFLLLEKEFSVVMKSQNPALLPRYIKQFELAAILNVDTTKFGL